MQFVSFFISSKRNTYSLYKINGENMQLYIVYKNMLKYLLLMFIKVIKVKYVRLIKFCLVDVPIW